MAKKEKESKSEANPVVAPNLVEDERELAVYLVDYCATEGTPELVVVLCLNNVQQCIAVRDALKEVPADAQTPSLPPLLPLSRQLIRVGDTAVRETLLNHREANRIDVYALPAVGPGVGDAGGAGRRPSRTADKKTKAAAAAAGAKGKGQTAAVNHTGPPENARCVGGTALSLIPLLTSTSLEVTVPLSVLSIGRRELRFRVCCRDAPLLTPEALLRCRPVVLRVGGVQGLPSMPAVPGINQKDAGPTPPATVSASPRVLRARVQLGDACVLTPALAVVPPTTSGATAPRRTSFASLVSQSLTSCTADRSDASLDYYEHVLFLSAMGSPLEVYRQLYATPCRVSLWQSFKTGALEETVTSPVKGKMKKGKSETLLGSGGFSVRDFLSDDQLRFSEVVQLLPDRSSVSLAGGKTCLTTASSIKVNLDFFQPFPTVQHVDSTGAVLQRRAFLTHAVLRLPYHAPWMTACLSLLLQEITSAPRAIEDVQLYTPPPPPSPSAASQDNAERAVAPSRTGPNTKASTAGGGGSAKRASKKSAVAKPDTGGSAKTSGRATASIPAPAPAAPPTHAFDAPLQLITPPGLSGFEVTDGKERVWCLEGAVPEVHQVLTKLTAFFESQRCGETAGSVLFNAELFVPARAYLTFPALVTPPVAAKAAGVPPALDAAATAHPAGGSVALEVEPSGTGGRLHRIRLRTTLSALRQTQAHYVRHTLSDDCLDCLTCLSALRGATSMREVELRGWLPSATLLIALERSFGQTLEKDDLYGATPPPSPTKDTTAAASAAVAGRTVVEGDAAPAAAFSSVMDGAAVGSLVSFDGAIMTESPHRRIPAAASQRFPVTSWMVVSGTGEEVLCAFAQVAPTGLVQYHVEGQVVQAAAVTLLYVLKCVCLARSFTHSHNTEYEQLLRERQRAQQAHLVRKSMLWPSNAAETSPRAGTGSGGGGRRRGKLAHVRHSSRHSHAASAAAGRGAPRTLVPSSDDEGEEDDWLASDFYDNVAGTSTAHHASPLFGASATTATAKDRRRGPLRHSVAKDRLQTRDATTAQKAVADKELWRLYNERAPAATSGIASVEQRLPPLYH